MLEVRPLTAGEQDLFLSLNEPTLVGVQSFGRDYREFAALGQYRPEWTWVALRDDVVVARAAWWAGPDDDKPMTLDWLDFAPGEDEAAVEILRKAGFGVEYCLLLPPRWRDNPTVRVAAEARIEVARKAGMQPLVERLRYRWTPQDGLPARPGRLTFREEPDDDVILDVLRRIMHGSLDAQDVRTREKDGVDAAARNELAFFQWMPSPRDWWRLAFTQDGELVGLTVPGRNYAVPVIGSVGVVPEQRGHGYAYDLLVEATHLLVEAGVEEIVADTDTTNTPMAATFARAGYPITQERVYLHQMDTLAAARYAAMRWNTPLSESHADELLDHLDLGEATRVVDLGCGWGELLLRAAKRTTATVIGVDTDPTGLDRGRRAALDRGLDVTFVDQPAEEWRGTADRALCIGSSHTLGGTRPMLARLAETVPHGRVLVGDGCWESPPTDAAHTIFGDDVLPLADLVTACADTGWQVLHLSTASQHEWDEFESSHRAGPREWLLANPDDPRAAQVRHEQNAREQEYLTAYRGVLGFAYLVLAR